MHSHFYAFPKKRRACSEITLQTPDFIQSTCTPLSTLSCFPPAHGSRFTALARRISRVIFRWVFADTPVTRRGKIFPVSEVNFERNSGLHISTAPCGMSMRRCGIDRLHVRKRILRSTLLNSVIIADFRLILGVNLSHLTVQRATLQERIVLHLLQAPWRTRALLVARCDVARWGLPLRFRLRAFQNNDISWHSCDLLTRSRYSTLFFVFVKRNR